MSRTESLMSRMRQGNDRSMGMDREEMAEVESTGADLALAAAAGSVLLSWYRFYYQGDRLGGIFVGLWPPTILAFASYLRQKSTQDRLESSPLINPRSMGRIFK